MMKMNITKFPFHSYVAQENSPRLGNYSFSEVALFSFVQSFETEQERTMYVSPVPLILSHMFETLYVVVH